MGKSLITNASLPLEWSKFMTDVKLVKDLDTSNFDQLHAYLEQYELHANEVLIPQVAYQSPQAPAQLMTESPFVDSSFVVPVFSPKDDPIACLNKAIDFLTAVASSRVTVQQVQGIQRQNYSGTTYKSNATSSRGNTISGQARVVKCYNCQGEGHMARQCIQPKRPRNAAWYKEKAMLAEAQEAGQDYWLSISRDDNLGLSRSHTSTIGRPILRVIHKMITYGLCQRTTVYDKVQKNDLWLLSMFDARHQNGKRKVLTEDVVRSLSAPVYCRYLDSTTLRDLIDSDGKLIPEDPQPGVPRVGIPRPPRASMQDLYDRIVFHRREPTTHLAKLSRSMTSTISSTNLRHHSISSSRMMTSSVKMAQVGCVTACLGHEKEENARDELV
ncbi:retrovirus-related pol polyprotein from transposon TNT 1-94 [Tanacetum coccineum]